MIIEIAFDLKHVYEQQELEELLKTTKIPYYVEPANRFNSLEDVECQCEGK